MIPSVQIADDVMRTMVARTSNKLLTRLQTIDPTITAIHYDYGHLTDVRERLITQSNANPSATRYPLVWLIEDFKVSSRLPGIFGVADVRIMILHTTLKEYTRKQREDLVIKPILIPIYEELFRQMFVSGKFMQYGPFIYDRIDRPHWGNPAEWNNKGYLFNEPLDGIEISGLTLQIYFNNCVTAQT